MSIQRRIRRKKIKDAMMNKRSFADKLGDWLVKVFGGVRK